MTELTVRCLHQPADLLGLRDAINALNQVCEPADPFSTCEFYRNFLERGLVLPQSELQLWFLAAFRGSELVGYLALKRVARSVLGLRTHGLEFLVGHEVDRPHLVARPEHLVPVGRVLFEYLMQHRAQWSWLELQGQTAGSALDPTRLGLRLPGCMTREFPNWDNCTIALRWRSVQHYVQALSKNMRGELRRRLRRLTELGNLELLASSDPLATPALFDLYCGIEQHSWKSQTEVAIGGAVRAEYIRGLLDIQQPMRILIQILLLDGVPIAGLICGAFTASGTTTLYALHLAYDSRLAAASPGSAVLLMGVRHAIEQGCARMNLLAGFTYYKTRWLAQTTPTHSIQVYRRWTLLWWRRVMGDLWRRVRRPTRAEVSFNPLRQAHPGAPSDAASGATANGDGLEISAAERRRVAAKIAEAHLGACTTLTAAEIVASAAVTPAPQPASVSAKRQRPPQRGGKRSVVHSI